MPASAEPAKSSDVAADYVSGSNYMMIRHLALPVAVHRKRGYQMQIHMDLLPKVRQFRYHEINPYY
jgi:hypothetical protein